MAAMERRESAGLAEVSMDAMVLSTAGTVGGIFAKVLQEYVRMRRIPRFRPRMVRWRVVKCLVNKVLLWEGKCGAMPNGA